MRFVLVHGWGFHAGIFADLIPYLDGAEVTLVDLGFVAGGPKGEGEWPEDAVAVGHSLGLLWLLERGGGRFRALVSVQGFDCFCCHVAPSRLAALKRGLERDPGGTLQAFWRSCGASGFALPDALNVARLDEGLDWLMTWDARKARETLSCPVLALASRDDVIVPPSMSEAIWGEEIIWSPDGGHVLPLKRPEWCVRHVLEFANALPS
ncbi:MAG: alpha/beta fold hydrolase [Actinomycetota bacterium]